MRKKKKCLHAFWFYELERVFWEVFILINKATVIYGRCFQNIGVIQSCSILCDLMDCSPPGSSVPGILQTRMVESVAISLSRGSSWPRDWTQVSYIACWFFNHLSHHGSSLLSIVPVDLCTLIIYQISLATFKWWLLLV